MLHRESGGMRKCARARHAVRCGPVQAEPTTRAPSGEETWWAAYLFFSFASPKLSAAELMQ